MAIVTKPSPFAPEIAPGCELLRINGQPIKDVLDYMFYSYENRLEIEYQTPDGRVRTAAIKKPAEQELGFEFDSFLMDTQRSCANDCIFCFINQLPPKMRGTVYLKDDDWRMSFLHGSYVTLTNVSDRELDRICKLKVSPINISVHTTNPDLRCQMLKNRRAGRILEQMRKLAGAGITLNCQIVLCPGVNEAEELVKTLSDLCDLAPAVNSVSVVPVGLTRFRRKLDKLNPLTKKGAKQVVDICREFGQACLDKLGNRTVYCADEIYIKAGVPMPDAAFYQDFPQLENGVGMSALFEEQFMERLEQLECIPEIAPFTIATGAAAFPMICRLIDFLDEKCDNMLEYKVAKIENNFFGKRVTVSGLVCGGDIVKTLKGNLIGERLILPSSMLRFDQDLFLDDSDIAGVQAGLSCAVQICGTDGGCLIDIILDQ